MNVFFLLATALTVSADAFFCGFSLSLGGEKKGPVLAGICVTVLLLCIAANLLGNLLAGILTEQVSVIGGFILIAVGFYNLMNSGEPSERKGVLKKCVVVGFAVGLDGAAATLSLSLMGYTEFYVPLVITAMHFFTILLGSALSETRAFAKIRKAKAAAPLLLVALGAYKVISAFV